MAGPTNPPGVAFYSKCELVYARLDDGRQVFWSLDTNRCAVTAEWGYEVAEGGLCGEHGLEHEPAGMVESLDAALDWVAKVTELKPETIH